MPRVTKADQYRARREEKNRLIRQAENEINTQIATIKAAKETLDKVFDQLIELQSTIYKLYQVPCGEV